MPGKKRVLSGVLAVALLISLPFWLRGDVTTGLAREVVAGPSDEPGENPAQEESSAPAAPTEDPASGAPSGPNESTADTRDTTLPAEIQAKIEAAMETSNVRGLSMAVFRGKEIIGTYYGGFMDAAKTKPVDSRTKYRIASVSKTVTGILVMQLVEQGRLDLDEDISTYMGVTVRSPSYPDVPITTRMLMTHTSSIIGGEAYNVNSNDPPYPPLTTILESEGCFTSAKPGTRFRYSNMGAAMEGGVIEGVTGKRFYDYAGEVFDALGMDAGYVRTKIRDTDAISPARNADVPNWPRVEGAYDTIPLGQMYLLGHGDLIINAEDLVQFAIALAGDGSTKTARILTPASVQAINTVYTHTGGDGIGLNMSMTDDLVEGRTIFGHSGQAYGMIAGLYFDPTDSTGVAFITNSCSTAKNEKGKYRLTGDLMEIVYGDILAME